MTQQPDISITLPLPPGSNERLIPVIRNGRPLLVLSAAARAWLTAAQLDVFAQRQGRFLTNCVLAEVRFGASGYDADAPIKLLFDALEKGGAVSNDRIIRAYTVSASDAVKPGWIHVALFDTGEAYERPKRNAARDTTRDALVRTFGRRHSAGRSRRA